MDVEQIELLPCPFCGGSAFMVQEGTHAQCLTPGCCVGPICGLDSWNTRAALTPPEGYVMVTVDVAKDAERYGWLRDNAGDEWDVTRWLDGEVQEIHVQDYLDEAIDTAMIATRPEVKP